MCKVYTPTWLIRIFCLWWLKAFLADVYHLGFSPPFVPLASKQLCFLHSSGTAVGAALFRWEGFPKFSHYVNNSIKTFGS
jgi:hypothetical protein